jgi:hypothetical protein
MHARRAPGSAGKAGVSSTADPVIGYVAHDGRQAVADGAPDPIRRWSLVS